MFNAFFLALFLLCSNVFAGGAKTVWVNAYTKSNGTYVSGHYRSPPTGTSSGTSSYVGSYSSSSYATTSVRSNEYCYDVKVWIDGVLLSSGGNLTSYDVHTSGTCYSSGWISSGGRKAEYTEEAAAEKGILLASEAVQSYYFKKGLKASQVFEKTNRVFMQENCFATVISTQLLAGTSSTTSSGWLQVVPPVVDYHTTEQCAISDVSNK